MVKTLGQVAEYWLSDPQRARRTAGAPRQRLSRSVGRRRQAHGRRAGGAGRRSPTRRDKRFADPEWSPNQFFDFLKQAYLLTTRLGRASGRRTPTALDPHTRQKAEFYVRQIANALSPSNFVLTNPELLRETLRSQRRESRARHAHAGRGHRGRRRRSEDPPVRRRDVRGRPQSRASRPAR